MVKSKKTKRQSRAKSFLRLGAGSILLSGVIGAVALGAYIYQHQHIEAGQFKVSDTYIGENLDDSLDLKVADKASYPSAPIKIVSELGQVGQSDRKTFSFQVKDDKLTEYGLLSLPLTPKPKNGYPALILLHGFASPRDYDTGLAYSQDMAFYSQHGFAVFKPDYRGLGLTVHESHPDSAFYSMSYNTDVMSLISALRQTAIVDKSDISLWGHSMGAYIGLRAAVLSPYVKNLIILSGPVDSLAKMYETYLPPSDGLDPYALATRNEVFAKYHTPSDESQFWRDASPIYNLAGLKAKVQIHVGLDDGVVPPEFSADLNSALDQAGIKHQYFVYPSGDHSLASERELIWARSLQALDNAAQ